MNLYPYSNGHLMVAPYRHVAAPGDLDEGERAEMWALLDRSLGVLSDVMAPHGFNAGINIGRVAGAGRRGSHPPARRPALERRHELHAGAGRRQGDARAPDADGGQAARRLARLNPWVAASAGARDTDGDGEAVGRPSAKRADSRTSGHTAAKKRSRKSTGVRPRDAGQLDWCEAVTGSLVLGGAGEQDVVAPGAVDEEVLRREPDLGEAGFAAAPSASPRCRRASPPRAGGSRRCPNPHSHTWPTAAVAIPRPFRCCTTQ